MDQKRMDNYCTCARPEKDVACTFESEEQEPLFRVKGTCVAGNILNYGFIVLWKCAGYSLF